MIKILRERTTWLQRIRMEDRERAFTGVITDLFHEHYNILFQFLEACGITLKDKSSISIFDEYGIKKEIQDSDNLTTKFADIFIQTRAEIIIIENKVWSGENGKDANDSSIGQLRTYREWAEKNFPDLDKYYILLYPETNTNCRELSDNNYTEITYGKLIEIMENDSKVMDDITFNDFVYEIKRSILKTINALTKKNVKEKLENAFGREFEIHENNNGEFWLNYLNTNYRDLSFYIQAFSHNKRSDISLANRLFISCKTNGHFNRDINAYKYEKFGEYIEIDEDNIDDSLNNLVEVLQDIIDNYGEEYKQKYCKEKLLSASKLIYYIRKHLKADFADKVGMILETPLDSDSRYSLVRYQAVKGFHYEIYGVDENYCSVKPDKAVYLYSCLHVNELDIETHERATSSDVAKNRLVKIDINNLEETAEKAVDLIWQLYNKYDAGLRKKYRIE